MHYDACNCLFVFCAFGLCLTVKLSSFGFWPDCKPEGPLFSAEFVSLSVSVSDRHFYPSTLTDFDET